MATGASCACGMSRRRLLGAAGVAGVAAVGASGCGGPEPTPHDNLHGQVIAQTGDVPVGGGMISMSDKLVITQPEEGRFKAFSAVCAHAGCTVQEITDHIRCLCHGSRFDIATGEVLAGPATEPLEAFEVSVDGTDITLV
ncbi:Rieske (2Fe-2S) protein [Marinactinospora thermotolerans]|uniref:Cytochrome bc1 complex Rieske iron-sulfur subunit n=1 Tax=Marinactinospora thermotolerans DSM 45154 TaxID=1122192 RepID=A0A1T4S1H5_9ACTN|nr:Rieske (2Fe-2S) protein [Marinactinospora thermotolerans]SKA22065.1 Tat (twin-arginine translocation) pathway signal sequence [Marinactinospora thermotolerans DSM 45154]